MDDQCSADDAQIDVLPQASYVSEKGARAIGSTIAGEAPVYDTPVSYAITDAVRCSSSLDDDDMLRWLHYPVEDSIDKGYCSDLFGELPLSDEIPEMAVPFSMAHVATMNTSTEAEAAMALGFGRVAGLVKQPGSEAFTKVRTTLLPPISTWSQISASKLQNLTSSQLLNERKGDLSPSFDPSSSHKSPTGCDHMKLPPSKSSLPISQMNFPHFSRLAVAEKAKCITRIAKHIQQESNYYSTVGNNRTDGSTTDSATSAGDTSKSQRELDIRSAFVQSQSSQGCSASHESSSKPADTLAHKGGAECQLQLHIGPNSTTLGSASSMDAVSPQLGDSVEFTEVTVTTSSGGSGNLCWKMSPSNLKKDSKEMDVSTDLQSEDAGESIDLKKPTTGRGSTKRNRAAEVHNLSERRRRDRINEKMKALQELIPNSDKCDKASILDEAIEYVKLLQVQIQMMFLRSGMTIPATIIPSEMQHLQMPRVTSLPHLGMGIGLGTGIGLGMGLPIVTTTGQPTIALQSLAGTAHISSGPTYAANARNKFQSSSVMDNDSGYKDHQQVQRASQPLNMDVWNAYMMHQLQYRQVHQGNEQNQQPNNVT